VDSSVAAALIHRAIGDQLTCVFVDHGLLRLNEAQMVMDMFVGRLQAKVVHVDASEQFLGHLQGVSDPEAKRKIIGREFVEVFQREAKKLQNAILSRFKLMAGVNIAEKRIPQDGRIKFKVDGTDIDFRVSTCPAYYGESVVLRILRPDSVRIGLLNIGFEQDSLDVFNKIIRRPNGIFLVTGPTGSGKTTTLYSALDVLNTPDRKIITAEDPVEYNFNGINQVQIREHILLSRNASSVQPTNAGSLLCTIDGTVQQFTRSATGGWNPATTSPLAGLSSGPLFTIATGRMGNNNALATHIRPGDNSDLPSNQECPADFNQDGGIDGADIEAFFLAWEAGESNADVNVDGGVDSSDVEAFFLVWSAGGC
jgi:hypothetical protein